MKNKVIQQKNKREQFFDSIAYVLPGILTWGLILLPIWLTFVSARASILVITFTFVYMTGVTLLFVVGSVLGYFKYKRQIKVNWQAELDNLNFDELPDQRSLVVAKNGLPFFAIIIPSLNDPLSTVFGSLEAVYKSDYPKDNTLVVLTLENKDPKWAKSTKLAVEKKFGKKLNLLVTIHNQEAHYPQSAATNRKWGAYQAEQWLNDKSIPHEAALLMTFDIDTIIHPKYLSATAHRYLVTENRNQRFFSTGAFCFDNNIWKTHLFARLQASTQSTNQLAVWIFFRHLAETFSIYAINFATMKEIDYWDPNLIVDDSVTSIRLFFHFNGDFHGEPIYLPAHADAVESNTFLKTHIALYKQLKRWGWGTVAETRAFLQGLSQKWKEIPLLLLLRRTFFHFFKVSFMTASIFLITIGFVLIRLVDSDVNQAALTTNISSIITLVLSVMGVSSIVFLIVRQLIFNPMPAKTPIWKRFYFIIEMGLVFVNMILFNVFPYIEAQTRPFFRGRVGFHPTKKEERT